MKAYLCASYSRKREISVAAGYLRDRGADVVSDWHEEHYSPDTDLRKLEPDVLEDMAQKDITHILESDTVIFFSEPQDKQPPRGSRHVEFGMCLAWGKTCFVVGAPENLFHYLPNVHCVKHLDEVFA